MYLAPIFIHIYLALNATGSIFRDIKWFRFQNSVFV